jgi:mannose-6-phosphate isomerase-like protein (cupin superfamily)
MPELVPAPSRVPVPGGKVIEEFAGRVASGDEAVSVAVMTAPPGWSEPAQVPDFDEVTVVLSGALIVDHAGGTLTVGAGQAVVTRAGERVRYSVGESGAQYVAVCVPAFAVERAHREAPD